MRILPFPKMNARKSVPYVADWSQQEIADFYRAHRLLAENGAAIGIDRGVSDIGEPWLVFFDMASQDVFLHVARIEGACHLFCDPLNLRLSAADIASLIAEFEVSVRAYLSIRAERGKNVVIHPAARIIMSISAIFLLFKLESGEAHAKGMSEKTAPAIGGDTAGPTRLTDKSATAFARAQSAFARAFDAVDAPANAALLAGAILAGELALSSVGNKAEASVEAAKTMVVSHHEEQSVLQLLEGSEQHRMMAEQTGTSSTHVKAAPVLDILPVEKADQSESHLPQPVQPAPAKPVVAAASDKVMVPQHSDVVVEVPKQAVFGRSSELVAKTEPEAETNNGLKTLAQNEVKTGGILLVDAKTQNTAKTTPADTKPVHTDVSLGTLDSLIGKAGFAMTTSYDDAKSYALKEYLTKQMGGQFTFEYQSGKLLIEQINVESLGAGDIGVWTNVAADHSTMSVVGKAAIIDDILTFFS